MTSAARTRTVEPDIIVFEMSGRLNLGNSLQSMEHSLLRLIDDGARKVVVDLTTLVYIDSAGLGMLIGCNGRMEQAGGQMRIAGAQGVVAQSLAIAHVDRVLALDPDVTSSCGRF